MALEFDKHTRDLRSTHENIIISQNISMQYHPKPLYTGETGMPFILRKNYSTHVLDESSN